MSNIKQLSRYELEKTDVQKSQISESVFPNFIPVRNYQVTNFQMDKKYDQIVSQILPIIIGHFTAATLGKTGHFRK